MPRDWLDSYERLLEWARLANITEEKVLTLLGKQAALSSESAARALARLKQFREALHTAYGALLSGKRMPQPILDELEVIWLEAQSRLRLEYSEDRARICRGHSCGWLFIDSSKGGQRVWCDMATCGNAAKTRRHQENAERRRQTGRRPARRGPE